MQIFISFLGTIVFFHYAFVYLFEIFIPFGFTHFIVSRVLGVDQKHFMLLHVTINQFFLASHGFWQLGKILPPIDKSCVEELLLELGLSLVLIAAVENVVERPSTPVEVQRPPIVRIILYRIVPCPHIRWWNSCYFLGQHSRLTLSSSNSPRQCMPIAQSSTSEQLLVKLQPSIHQLRFQNGIQPSLGWLIRQSSC